MTLYLPDAHPVIDLLGKEANLHVNHISALPQGPEVLRIGMVNLMPNPIDPERDFGRLIASATAHKVALTAFAPSNWLNSGDLSTPSRQHRAQFHRPMRDIKTTPLDGLIITGHGDEEPPFEDIAFWPELCDVLDHAREAVPVKMTSCWGAHAALYRYHGIPKTYRDEKLSGVFQQTVVRPFHPMFRDLRVQNFPMPVSRRGRSDEEAIKANPHLQILSESPQTGSSIVFDALTGTFNVTGHPEYDVYALPSEYSRDTSNAVPHTQIPVGVFVNDNPRAGALLKSWDRGAQCIMNGYLAAVAAAKNPVSSGESAALFKLGAPAASQ